MQRREIRHKQARMTLMSGLALNAENLTTDHVLALNVALGDGAPPEWVELIPAGRTVTGIDGRSWINDQPQGILDHFARYKAHNRELPIDYEHASELKAPNGEQAPAAAWGTELAIREGGSIWARVEWTPKGLEAVANREYRYLSPVLIYEKKSSRIVGIASVGLTNKPNLTLTALNQEGDNTQQETDMLKRICAKLGLAETASEDDVMAAIGDMQQGLATAKNRAESPSLEKFVPRGDYDAALTRANNAEQAVAAQKKAELETAINTEIASALKLGKITPATVDYHKAACKENGGLERFKKFVGVAPELGAESGLDGKKTPDGTDTALNGDQAKIAAMFGNTAEDLKQYGSVN
ncbi:MAG: phage protease [Proteobacteria bacterium]|nr:phage protease [Pseudomonadota bacterium]MBU1648234.1 phage protease [Pseudomonadota bacterium]